MLKLLYFYSYKFYSDLLNLKLINDHVIIYNISYCFMNCTNTLKRITITFLSFYFLLVLLLRTQSVLKSAVFILLVF